MKNSINKIKISLCDKLLYSQNKQIPDLFHTDIFKNIPNMHKMYDTNTYYYGLFRYEHIVQALDEGQRPEEFFLAKESTSFFETLFYNTFFVRKGTIGYKSFKHFKNDINSKFNVINFESIKNYVDASYEFDYKEAIFETSAARIDNYSDLDAIEKTLLDIVLIFRFCFYPFKLAYFYFTFPISLLFSNTRKSSNKKKKKKFFTTFSYIISYLFSYMKSCVLYYILGARWTLYIHAIYKIFVKQVIIVSIFALIAKFVKFMICFIFYPFKLAFRFMIYTKFFFASIYYMFLNKLMTKNETMNEVIVLVFNMLLMFVFIFVMLDIIYVIFVPSKAVISLACLFGKIILPIIVFIAIYIKFGSRSFAFAFFNVVVYWGFSFIVAVVYIYQFFLHSMIPMSKDVGIANALGSVSYICDTNTYVAKGIREFKFPFGEIQDWTSNWHLRRPHWIWDDHYHVDYGDYYHYYSPAEYIVYYTDTFTIKKLIPAPFDAYSEMFVTGYNYILSTFILLFQYIPTAGKGFALYASYLQIPYTNFSGRVTILIESPPITEIFQNYYGDIFMISMIAYFIGYIADVQETGAWGMHEDSAILPEIHEAYFHWSQNNFVYYDKQNCLTLRENRYSSIKSLDDKLSTKVHRAPMLKNLENGKLDSHVVSFTDYTIPPEDYSAEENRFNLDTKWPFLLYYWNVNEMNCIDEESVSPDGDKELVIAELTHKEVFSITDEDNIESRSEDYVLPSFSPATRFAYDDDDSFYSFFFFNYSPIDSYGKIIMFDKTNFKLFYKEYKKKQWFIDYWFLDDDVGLEGNPFFMDQQYRNSDRCAIFEWNDLFEKDINELADYVMNNLEDKSDDFKYKTPSVSLINSTIKRVEEHYMESLQGMNIESLDTKYQTEEGSTPIPLEDYFQKWEKGLTNDPIIDELFSDFVAEDIIDEDTFSYPEEPEIGDIIQHIIENTKKQL